MRTLDRTAHAPGAGSLESKLREQLLEIGRAGIAAVDPAAAVKAIVRADAAALHVADAALPWSEIDRVVVLGAGKASARMAGALEEQLGDRVSGGLVIVKDGHGTPTARVEIVEASHPYPDARGECAARRLLNMARQAGPRDVLLCCISGGGSCLTPAVAPGVALEALQELTDQLLRSGATINAINAVRKHLSVIHGGRLAAAAHPARVLALIVSDVVDNPLDVIASGPTVPDPTTYAGALGALDDHGLRDTAPVAIREHLQRGAAGNEAESPKPGDPRLADVRNAIIADNAQAAGAVVRAARARGFEALHVTSAVEGEAREFALALAGTARDIARHERPVGRPGCVIFGGETTVTVRGAGTGGRNQEMALAAAIALEGTTGAAVMALATDGTDGPTGAAGGLVDGGTVARARAAGVDAARALSENDSHAFLAAAGDLIETGPTHTNVNDLYVAVGW